MIIQKKFKSDILTIPVNVSLALVFIFHVGNTI